MHRASSTNFMATVVFVLIMLSIAILCFRSAYVNQKKARQRAEEEQTRRLERERALRKANEEHIRQEQLRNELKAQKQKELEQIISDIRSEFKQYCIDKNSQWPDELIEDSKLERAYMQRKQMQILAYDPRYHVSIILGTTQNRYLTSASFCTCKDFRVRRLPCKHMFFLAHEMTGKKDNTFIEEDYEKGLLGVTGFVFGRFSNGKENAIANLNERGMIVLEHRNKECQIAVAGKTTAVKQIEKLAEDGIPVFDYSDALQIFTSEIRHSDII